MFVYISHVNPGAKFWSICYSQPAHTNTHTHLPPHDRPPPLFLWAGEPQAPVYMKTINGPTLLWSIATYLIYKRLCYYLSDIFKDCLLYNGEV